MSLLFVNLAAEIPPRQACSLHHDTVMVILPWLAFVN